MRKHARFIHLLLAAIALLMTCLPLQAQNRHALVIGLGEQKDKLWEKIHGDHDVTLVAKRLRKAQYKDITTLTNKEATKAAIVHEMKKMAARCRPGDIVYVHYSGHGQLMTDVNGDEPNGWDQAWIPYDAYFMPCDKDRGEKHLCDDETAALLAAIRQKLGDEGTILVVVDACYSGDSTRDLKGTAPSPTPTRGVLDKFVIPTAKAPAKTTRIPERWLTLTACQKYETCTELPNGYGRLSYALCSLWDTLKTKNNSQVEAAIADFFLNPDFATRKPQSPTLTGDRANQLLRKALGN